MADYETPADDALLSAYLDGALPPEKRHEIEARLAADAALAGRLAALLAVDDRFRKEAGRIDREPMSASLSAFLGRLEAEMATNASNVVPFPLWRRSARFVERHRAMAASLVAVAGASMLHVVLSDSAPAHWSHDGRVPASSDIARALGTQHSGEPATLRVGHFTARLSFRSKSGEFCRVFDITGDGANSQNVACKDEHGWRLALTSFSTEASAPEGVYTTASAHSDPVLEEYLDSAIEGEPMNRTDESRAIANDWRAASE